MRVVFLCAPSHDRLRVLFATHEASPGGTADDALAIEVLRRGGIEAGFVPWSRLDAFAAHGAVVLRSTWDYHRRFDEFRRWLADLARSGARVFNPLQTVLWNVDKRYLLELAGRGLPVVPTELVHRGDLRSDLAALGARRGWREVVVKPAVSAGGHQTFRGGRSELSGAFQTLRAECDVLVQPFVPEIGMGELSFVFFGGVFSHAVRKRAQTGEFRVQKEHGGTVESAPVSAQQVEQAQHLLSGAGVPSLYARVDAVETERGLLLMELELIEPELFLRFDPSAPARFAQALTEALG